jgi:thioredoxin reductase (NADPH)
MPEVPSLELARPAVHGPARHACVPPSCGCGANTLQWPSCFGLEETVLSENPAPVPGQAITTEVVIIGAGPCGLFQVFELGLLGIKAHLVDSLAHPGGQCAELYPEKPIYDIPAIPVCGAQELVDRLMKQIEPFHPSFHLGQEVIEFQRQENGRFRVRTTLGTTFDTGTVVIAAGVGSFQPRRIGIDGSEAFEGTSVHYRVKNSSNFHGQHLVIFGGGDSALDWTLELLPKARSVTLVHRRPEYRAAPASVAKMQEHVAAGRMRVFEALPQSFILDNGQFRGVNVKAKDGATHALNADQLLVFFGLHPKLGPIAEWGLELDKKALKVDTEKFQTSLPGVFAVGDINTYPGKKKLILSGFHEAALAAFAIQHHLYPQKKQFLQYTTTSPIMHQRLGVPD